LQKAKLAKIDFSFSVNEVDLG